MSRIIVWRIHLDDSTSDNGPLRVLPASLVGKLDADQIANWKSAWRPSTALSTEARLGFRPLLLHASSSAVVPRHRRVLHFEFAIGECRTDSRGTRGFSGPLRTRNFGNFLSTAAVIG